MSAAAWRIRKRVKVQYDRQLESKEPVSLVLDWVLNVIDEEIELEAERQFTQRINPDPVTDMAKEVK